MTTGRDSGPWLRGANSQRAVCGKPSGSAEPSVSSGDGAWPESTPEAHVQSGCLKPPVPTVICSGVRRATVAAGM